MKPHEIEERLAIVNQNRLQYLEEVASNRRFLAGVAAAAFAGAASLLSNAEADGLSRILLRLSVCAAAAAFIAAAMLFWGRERLLWGTWWMADARLRGDAVEHPTVKAFYAEDYNKTESQVPSFRTLEAWTALLLVFLLGSGLLAAAAFW